MKKLGYLRVIIMGLFIITPLCFYSQSQGLTDTLYQGEKLFKKSEFVKAIPYYEHLNKSFPDTVYYQYKLGICYLYKSDSYSKALQYLKQVEEKKSDAPELDYYLGRAYHMNYDFSTAINYFTKSLETYKSKDERYKEVNNYIKNCQSGLEIYGNPRYVNITNVGAPINTEGIEYGPVISSNGNLLTFTYRGKESVGGLENGEYKDDILISKKLDNGLWSAPLSIGNKVNTTGNEAAIYISPNEKQLFIYKFTEEDRGDIYSSNFDTTTNVWSEPLRLAGDINTEFWEGSCCLSSDGKTLYFVSARIGGYGGKDIWKATLQEDGSWKNLVNLGPEINTENDEDGPFLYPNGKVLFFNSNGLNSIGGMDIFQSELSDDGYWGQPINLGYPINSVTNDIYYTISTSGRGYYSSETKGGYGKQDIYVVDPGFIGNSIVMGLIKGVVTKDGKPEGADILVTDDEGNEMREMFRSNAETGGYVLTLLPGKEYNITYTAEDGTKEMKKINLTDLDSFTVINLDVDFNTLVNDKLNKAYNTAIENADQAFKNEDYLNAIVYYSQALGYKPNEQYPKDGIIEARKRLNAKMKNGEEIVMNNLQDKYQGGNYNSGDKGKQGENIIIKKEAIDKADNALTQYSLQIAASLKKGKALSIKSKFKKLGFDIYLQIVTFTDVNETWYRVRIGNFNSLDKAVAEATKLLNKPLPHGKVWVDVKRKDNFSTLKMPYGETGPLIEK